MSAAPHPGDLALRRVLAGEPAHGDLAHTEGCAECRSRLRSLEEEQRRFEAEIPFERFAAGVERAARAPRAPVVERRPAWVAPLLSAAALVVVVVAGAPLLHGREAGNRLKGGASLEVVVAASNAGPQREASADPRVPEALAPGDRVRLGYQAGDRRFVTAASIDEHGAVTPLYPERGQSLPVEPGAQTHFLPESIEFTGAGVERVVLLLTDAPMPVETLALALSQAYLRAGRDLARLERVDLPGDQFQRSFLKP